MSGVCTSLMAWSVTSIDGVHFESSEPGVQFTHRGVMEGDVIEMKDTNTVVLVGCGKAKKDTKAKARDLYTSSYFQSKREFAETADEWYILSAEYRIVDPERELEPYDVTMTDYTSDEREYWAETVNTQAKWRFDNDATVIVLAGRSYTDPLRDQPQFEDAIYPFDNTSGMGKQMGWLADEQTTLDGNTIDEILL